MFAFLSLACEGRMHDETIAELEVYRLPRKRSDEGCQSAKPHFGFGENPAMKLDDATVLEILALLQ